MANGKIPPKFSRSRPSQGRTPVKLILAVEGKTERAYLKWIAAEAGLKSYEIQTKISGVPRTCADEAKAAKKDAKREGVDEILAAAVCDCDEHPKIGEARDVCTGNELFLAFSNPCCELWFLLHFRDQTAFIDRHAAKSELEKECPTYDKGDDLSPTLIDRLRTSFDEARKRAERLRQRHRDNGSAETENPSTNLDELVVRIRQLAAKATGGAG